MSSTNVHSEQNNIQIVGGYTIPTENEMEMPPKSAGRGPSTLDVRQGDTMEITVEDSVLHKDGKLVATTGKSVAKFDEKAFKMIAARYADRQEELETDKGLNTRRDVKSGITSKGEER